MKTMKNKAFAIALALVLVFAGRWLGEGGVATNAGEGLPVAQIRLVLERIESGQPHPYRRDGSTFFNREGLLPKKATGFYREYTLPTPGERGRGARRLVTGGKPPQVFYYTPDHYRSFQRFEPQALP